MDVYFIGTYRENSDKTIEEAAWKKIYQKVFCEFWA